MRNPSGDFSRVLGIWVWKPEKRYERETMFVRLSLNVTEFSCEFGYPGW